MKDPSPLDDGTTTTEPTPGLYRVAYAANRCGLSTEAFVTAADLGDIPVPVLRIGPRALRFVRATELSAFLQGSPRHEKP